MLFPTFRSFEQIKAKTQMTIRHHLNESLLMGYSSGQLPEAFSVVVATHLSLCDDCRARAASFDALGGELLAACSEVAMSEGALDASLRRICSSRPPRAKAPQREADLPRPLPDYLGPSLAAVSWRPIGMGVRQAILATSSQASVRLLHIPAGATVPDHGHRGLEMTLVLRGAFSDHIDRFGPGDVEIADEATEHSPVAELGEDCICLAATDAPLRFTGLIPRMAQTIFRF